MLLGRRSSGPAPATCPSSVCCRGRRTERWISRLLRVLGRPGLPSRSVSLSAVCRGGGGLCGVDGRHTFATACRTAPLGRHRSNIFWVAMTIGRMPVGPLDRQNALLRLAILLAIGGVIGAALVTVWTIPWIVVGCVRGRGSASPGYSALILAEAGARIPHYPARPSAELPHPRIGGAIFPGRLPSSPPPHSTGAARCCSSGAIAGVGRGVVACFRAAANP